jgi:hypothetical protein
MSLTERMMAQAEGRATSDIQDYGNVRCVRFVLLLLLLLMAELPLTGPTPVMPLGL